MEHKRYHGDENLALPFPRPYHLWGPTGGTSVQPPLIPKSYEFLPGTLGSTVSILEGLVSHHQGHLSVSPRSGDATSGAFEVSEVPGLARGGFFSHMVIMWE